MNQHTNQHTLWLALCIMFVGLTAYIAIPGAAQEQPPVSASLNPPGTVTKTCTVSTPQGCVIMLTNGNPIATRYIEDLTSGNPGMGQNNIDLQCQSNMGEMVGKGLQIDPSAGAPVVAVSCPDSANFLIMKCKPGAMSCTIRFSIY
jgi:hypothetical protein